MYIDTNPTSADTVLVTLARALNRPISRIIRRRKFNAVRDLDDHMLDDIGVTRGEVERAAQLPLSVNAAMELRRMSLERRREAR